MEKQIWVDAVKKTQKLNVKNGKMFQANNQKFDVSILMTGKIIFEAIIGGTFKI